MSDYSFEELDNLDQRFLWHPFTQAATHARPLLAVSAQGPWVRDSDGRDYLDMVSSWWVNLHGHANPVIAKAIAEQASSLEQVIFAEFTHRPAITLAARIAALLPGDLERVFYSDDGSTAVEVALKMALQYWRNLGQGRTAFVGFDGGYHGDTVGAMSVGQTSGYFSMWDDMMFPARIAPYPATWDGDPDCDEKEARALAGLEAVLEDRQVAAVIIEPLVQGASGMRMCRPGFLQQVESRVRQAGSLLIVDEVMTGFGRTGALFASDKAAISPDLICLSKGLTGGFLPMAMTVARPFIYDAFLGQDISRAFLHGHSYTANPLGCAAGLASLDLLLDPACALRRVRIEAIHTERLARLAAKALIAKPRHQGTIAAFEVPIRGDRPDSVIGSLLKREFRARGLILRPLGRVVYVLPPYCTSDDQLNFVWDEIELVLGRL
jgi:adenosylmethionine---8-amino-7-oxononanoate aminotransferase